MKISDFVKEKLINFETFLMEQFNKTNISPEISSKLLKELNEYKNDVNKFIQAIVTLSNYDIDNAIKLFLLNYNIDINEIKKDIDYDKLKRYLEMFIEIVKK